MARHADGNPPAPVVEAEAVPVQQGQPTAQQAPAPQCPYCRQPLLPGRIFGDRYRLKWLGLDVPLTLGVWAAGGHEIGHGGFMQFNRPHVFGWRCARCCKIIVDERA